MNEHPTPDAPNDSSTHPGCVLLLDDDIDVLAAIARFLRVNHYEVIVSNDARSALQHVQDVTIDAVVTDLRMPDMDGLEFAKAARLHKPLLPILFFSAYGSIPSVVEAMQLGAVDFLEKPVDPPLLLSRIDEICNSQYAGGVQAKMAFDDAEVPFRRRVLAYEKYLIEGSLEKHQWKVADVLEELNINRRTLNEKMNRLGIKRS